jgi:hypothetical protein
VSVKKNAVRHTALTATITNFVAFQGVNGDHAQGQAFLALKRVELFGDAIPNEVEHMGLLEIFCEGPGVLVAGEVTAATIAQNYMNGVPLIHAWILNNRGCAANSEPHKPASTD